MFPPHKWASQIKSWQGKVASIAIMWLIGGSVIALLAAITSIYAPIIIFIGLAVGIPVSSYIVSQYLEPKFQRRTQK